MPNTRRSRLGGAIGLVLTIAACAAVVSAQSGRKPETAKPQTPIEENSVNANSNSGKALAPTPEQNEKYRCTADGSPSRVVELADDAEVFTPKTVDVKAYISSRPKAGYTHEARRAGIQGRVVLRLVLLSNGEIGTIRVVRGLPAGLTENALRAACKLQFRPAIKDAKEVSQSLQIEYTFRLADPRIMR